jgi:glutamate formiminotransferase/formiminotetrahydrofolate cyclodeaminase
MLVDTRFSDFVEAVAAKTPTPGGGSVSAAVGALGTALGIMTARYSDAADVETALEEVKAEFLKLVDDDAKAYGQVNSAMSLPKGTEEEKLRRKAAVQNALSDAAEVPLKGMQLAARALGTLTGLAPRCNKHLASDLAGAVHFLEAALTGCGENVTVNASALHDTARRERLGKEHARIVAEGQALRASILKVIQKPAPK